METPGWSIFSDFAAVMAVSSFLQVSQHPLCVCTKETDTWWTEQVTSKVQEPPETDTAFNAKTQLRSSKSNQLACVWNIREYNVKIKRCELTPNFTLRISWQPAKMSGNTFCAYTHDSVHPGGYCKMFTASVQQATGKLKIISWVRTDSVRLNWPSESSDQPCHSAPCLNECVCDWALLILCPEIDV